MFAVYVVYGIVINLLGAGVTLWDKHCAKEGKWRVRESTLLLVAACGGSAAMYITMRWIRHKTRKMKFMLGIPSIFLLQGLLIGFLLSRSLLPGI